MGKFAPHTILQKKRQERKCGRRGEERRTRAMEIAEENREKLEKYREL
jgi:hypothetical protein